MSGSFHLLAGLSRSDCLVGVSFLRVILALVLVCCLPEASAQIAVQSINYNLATQGRVTAAADAFTDSVSGNISGGSLLPNQTVQQDATGISDPNFGAPLLEGLTRLGVSDGSFGFSNPMRLFVTTSADMYLFRDPTSANSALGSSGGGSYFNEVTFTLATRSSVRLIGGAEGGAVT